MNKENKEMNRENRVKMVKAMELIARMINDEDVWFHWAAMGVADGDIETGDLTPDDPDGVLEYYLEDEHFAYTMETFLSVMARAKKSGGLYCDNVVSSFGKEQ